MHLHDIGVIPVDEDGFRPPPEEEVQQVVPGNVVLQLVGVPRFGPVAVQCYSDFAALRRLVLVRVQPG